MRVICPWTDLRPETRAALEADGIEAEYVNVNGSQTAYHELLERTWREGRGFVIVEHDIVPWPGALRTLWDCSCDWGGYAYPTSTAWNAWLGCTKFSDALVVGVPALWDAIANLRYDGTNRKYWGRLDTRMKQVLEDSQGLRMHVHWPAVGHPTKVPPIMNCACGKGIPDEVARLGPPWYCPACGTEWR